MYSRYYILFGVLACVVGIMLGLLSDSLQGIVSCIFSQRKNQEIVISVENECQDFCPEKCISSSVWCIKRLDGSKLCKFKNLYYFPEYKGHVLFILNEYSVLSGVDSHKELKKIALSSVKNHTGFNLNLVILKSGGHFSHKNITYIKNYSFIMKRFKPDNILHVIHDDILPLFSTFHELCQGNLNLCTSKYQLLFIDQYDKGPHFDWYSYFSTFDTIFLERSKSNLCIQNSVVGMSRQTVWYQYGFKTVHGPLRNTNFNGMLLQAFTDYIKLKFEVKNEAFKHLHSTQTDRPTAVLMSRTINRKILNEDTVVNYIKNIYSEVYKKVGITVIKLDLSINDTASILLALQRANVLIGMHGSAMILSMFLPQGSTIIEMFPFGIQPEIVSPVKHLCSLPNVFYKYEAWVNTNESNSIGHPEYPPLHGGIHHLPESQQREIMSIKSVPPVECCHNPLYLFKMFQDTIVDESFHDLVLNTLMSQTDIINEETYINRTRKFMIDRWYFPPPVFNINCVCIGTNLKVTWISPLETITSEVRFSLATSTGISVITKASSVVFELTECETMSKNFEKPIPFHISVWIKTMEGDKESSDTFNDCYIIKSFRSA